MFDQLLDKLSSETLSMIIRAFILVVLGLVVAGTVSRLLQRSLGKRLSIHHMRLLRRIAYYGLLTLFVASALRELGFSLALLMGAAGVLTVAVGFASQTSASNLISGLFLIGERPFTIGDIIKIGGTTGEVLSIDALSIKLRTFDNLFVRIPNETLIKSEVTNLTRFPIRRLDLPVGVAYKEDIGRVREVLLAVADQNPLCLDEPAPLFIFLGFGDSALDLQFSVWAKRENFLPLRNAIAAEIKAAFDTAGIEIPFPHRSLYAGEATRPFPVQIVPGPAGGDQPTRKSDR
ncbi:MAG: mechanosensitive ion channel family protein [Candidatus Krumholzibacteria bacterium]|jgi:small-conductance mechanosensitive channel|nr:mechanosensitive ion channel family protein [Candidatus Krumholzibacteria bacterium]